LNVIKLARALKTFDRLLLERFSIIRLSDKAGIMQDNVKNLKGTTFICKTPDI